MRPLLRARPFAHRMRLLQHVRSPTCFVAAVSATATLLVGQHLCRPVEMHARGMSNSVASMNGATNGRTKANAADEPPLSLQRDPSLQPLLSWLHSECRGFPVHSSDVRVLQSPDEFYSTLLSLASGAQRRVLLSSLYLGTGPHEQKLVEALRQSMQRTPDLRVDILLDYLRGTRLVGTENLSSLTAVAPLLQPPDTDANSAVSAAPAAPSPSSSASSSRFALHLLLLPPPAVPSQISAFRSWIERTYFTGNKTREAVAVHHMKFYVVDDCTIISGANLSDTYFTNRQDRYIMIKDKRLADFYSSLLGRITQLPFCHTVTQRGKAPAPLPLNTVPEDAEAEWQQRTQLGALLLNVFRPQPDEGSSFDAEGADTIVFPTLQMGTLGVTHDERITSALFELTSTTMPAAAASSAASLSPFPAPSCPSAQLLPSLPASLDVATGYMNLTDHYTHLLLQTRTPVRLIAAGVDANGWYGATGGGRYVPDLYAAAALELLEQTRAAGQSSRLHLYEWSKREWSYHAKGVWLTLAGASLPQLSLIGSPNFGARSVQRDSETALVIVTAAQSSLAQALHDERQRLLEHSSLVTLNGLNTDATHRGQTNVAVKPPLWLRFLSKIARPYM